MCYINITQLSNTHFYDINFSFVFALYFEDSGQQVDDCGASRHWAIWHVSRLTQSWKNELKSFWREGGRGSGLRTTLKIVSSCRFVKLNTVSKKRICKVKVKSINEDYIEWRVKKWLNNSETLDKSLVSWYGFFFLYEKEKKSRGNFYPVPPGCSSF